MSRDPHALVDFGHAALESTAETKSLADLMDLDVLASKENEELHAMKKS